MGTCRTSLILVTYTKPYETARVYAEARKTCDYVSVEERLGRIFCELQKPSPEIIARLTGESTSWSGEARLKCPPSKCGIKICGQHGTCLLNGRIVQVVPSKRGCTIRVGPRSNRLPRPPVPPTLFYTSSIDDLLDRMKYLDALEKLV